MGDAGDPVLLPQGNEALKGDFARDGFDLHIDLPSGDTIVVVDFYAGGPDALPTLTTETGARLLGETAAKLAGPETAGQVAQSGGVSTDAAGDAALGEPIGSVDAIKGTATVIRADGTGVVFVPAAIATKVLDIAEQIAAKERLMAEDIAAGRPVTDVMDKDYETLLGTQG